MECCFFYFRDVKHMLLKLVELRSSNWGRVHGSSAHTEATPENDPNYFMVRTYRHFSSLIVNLIWFIDCHIVKNYKQLSLWIRITFCVTLFLEWANILHFGGCSFHCSRPRYVNSLAYLSSQSLKSCNQLCPVEVHKKLFFKFLKSMQIKRQNYVWISDSCNPCLILH